MEPMRLRMPPVFGPGLLDVHRMHDHHSEQIARQTQIQATLVGATRDNVKRRNNAGKLAPIATANHYNVQDKSLQQQQQQHSGNTTPSPYYSSPTFSLAATSKASSTNISPTTLGSPLPSHNSLTVTHNGRGYTVQLEYSPTQRLPSREIMLALDAAVVKCRSQQYDTNRRSASMQASSGGPSSSRAGLSSRMTVGSGGWLDKVVVWLEPRTSPYDSPAYSNINGSAGTCSDSNTSTAAGLSWGTLEYVLAALQSHLRAAAAAGDESGSCALRLWIVDSSLPTAGLPTSAPASTSSPTSVPTSVPTFAPTCAPTSAPLQGLNSPIDGPSTLPDTNTGVSPVSDSARVLAYGKIRKGARPFSGGGSASQTSSSATSPVFSGAGGSVVGGGRTAVGNTRTAAMAVNGKGNGEGKGSSLVVE